MGTKLSSDKADIIRKYEEGQSIRAVAEEYGVAYSSIRRLLNKEGKVRKLQTIDPYLPAMYEDYLAGMNFAEIGRKYNWSHSTVSSNLMKKYKAKPLKRGRKSELEKYKEEWVSQYQSGKTLIAIAEEYGVSAEAVRKNIFKSKEGDTRSYHDALKKQVVDVSFFDDLEVSKAFLLGVLIAKIRKVEDVNTQTPKLRMTINKAEETEEYLEFLFGGWISEIPTIHTGEKSENYVEIRSQSLFDLLVRNGINSNCFLGEGEGRDEIMRGYLSATAYKSDGQGSLYIGLSRGKSKVIEEWLERNGIEYIMKFKGGKTPVKITIRSGSQSKLKELLYIKVPN